MILVENFQGVIKAGDTIVTTFRSTKTVDETKEFIKLALEKSPQNSHGEISTVYVLVEGEEATEGGEANNE